MNSTHCRNKHQRGQAVTEYAVVSAALAFILFFPIKNDVTSPDKAKTTVEIVLDGFKNAYSNFSYAISLPS